MDRQAEDAQPTMQQRIAERRALLQQKLRAKRSASGNAEAAQAGDVEKASVGKGEGQVRESRKVLSALKVVASDAITHFRVATDTEENERRIREEELAAHRKQRVAEDADSSFRAHGSIQMSFDNLFDRNPEVPQELARDLQLQREACAKVIAVKDRLIDEMRGQMRDKEEEYVRALKQQADDIDRLIGAMHTQTASLVDAYTRELASIEEAYVQERREMIEAQDKDIDALVLQRGNREREHVKRREQRVWDDQRVLDEKYEENAEKFNKSKMDNLHDIHGLAQELESLRARFLLNAEKLQYNLQVLRERVAENRKASDLHRKKLGTLQDVLSTSIAKYAETDKKYRQTNKELTEGYRRVTEQYKDLQLKFQHFEKADAEKYQHVWRMHEEGCMELVHKCLQGDRVVFEELLGVQWVSPSLDFWLEQDPEEVAATIGEEQLRADEEEEDQAELEGRAEAMLQVIYSQVPFLIEDKVRRVIDDMGEEESHSVKVESVFNALGLKQADVRQMLAFFVTTGEDGDAAMIESQEVVLCLQRFLEDKKRKAKASKTPKLDLSTVHGQEQSPDTRETKRDTEGKRRKRERDFWRRMSDVVPDSHLRSWRSMEEATGKYLRQLQKRQGLIEETDGIRKQNDELRALLNQYLGSRLNEELFAPPQLHVAPSPA